MAKNRRSVRRATGCLARRAAALLSACSYTSLRTHLLRLPVQPPRRQSIMVPDAKISGNADQPPPAIATKMNRWRLPSRRDRLEVAGSARTSQVGSRSQAPTFACLAPWQLSPPRPGTFRWSGRRTTANLTPDTKQPLLRVTALPDRSGPYRNPTPPAPAPGSWPPTTPARRIATPASRPPTAARSKPARSPRWPSALR